MGVCLQIASVILTEVKQQQKHLHCSLTFGRSSGIEFSSKYDLKHLARIEIVLLSFLCWGKSRPVGFILFGNAHIQTHTHILLHKIVLGQQHWIAELNRVCFSPGSLFKGTLQQFNIVWTRERQRIRRDLKKKKKNGQIRSTGSWEILSFSPVSCLLPYISHNATKTFFFFKSPLLWNSQGLHRQHHSDIIRVYFFRLDNPIQKTLCFLKQMSPNWDK